MAKLPCTREEFEQFKAFHRHITFFCDYQSNISESEYDCRKIELIEKADDLWPVFQRRCNEVSILLEIQVYPHSLSPKKTLDLEMFKKAIKTCKNYGRTKAGWYVNVRGVDMLTERGSNQTVMPQINNIFYTLLVRLRKKYFTDENAPESSPKKPARTERKIEPEEQAGQSKTNIPDYKALNLAKVPISRLIEQGESYTLEFKETLDYDTQNKGKNKDILLSSLKTIAGFLNAASGTLLIGVGDSGKIKGIGRDLSLMKNGNNDKFQLKIRNCLKDRFQPQPIGKVNISFEKFPEGTICRVDVQASEDIIHLDNRVYVREGNTTQLLDGRALTDWIQQ
jgi:hypothetical protein